MTHGHRYTTSVDGSAVRRGDAPLVLIGIGLVIAVGAMGIGLMFPDMYAQEVEIHVGDAAATQRVGTLHAMLDTYIDDAFLYGGYEGVHRAERRDLDEWRPDDPITQADVEDAFTARVKTVIEEDYLGALSPYSGCRFDRANISVAYDDTEDAYVAFDIAEEEAQEAICDTADVHAGRGLLEDREAGSFRTPVELPDRIELERSRHDEMYAIAAELVRSDAFQQTVHDQPVEKSSEYFVVDECRESGGECNWERPTVTAPSDTEQSVEAADQADNALPDLQAALDEIAADHAAEYDAFDITLTVETLEYEITGLQHAGVSDEQLEACHQRGTCSYTVRSCDAGSDCSCPSCPSDSPCGKSCRSDCGFSNEQMAPVDYPETDDTWTDAYWQIDNCGGGATPVSYDSLAGREPFAQLSAHRAGTAQVYTIQDDGDDLPSCGCDSDTRSDTIDTGTEVRAIEAWEMDLASRTVVEVNVTDTEEWIPTGDGLQQNFTFRYVSPTGATAGDGASSDGDGDDAAADDQTAEDYPWRPSDDIPEYLEVQ